MVNIYNFLDQILYIHTGINPNEVWYNKLILFLLQPDGPVEKKIAAFTFKCRAKSIP